jgi:hypothetical protein
MLLLRSLERIEVKKALTLAWKQGDQIGRIFAY